MKKCPNCQKEFPDSMRFCQTDGTPLGDPIAEAPADDPLKTTVVRQEDIFSSIPPADPFKTMVASSDTTDDSGDLLQLPEEFDPMKTMVVAPIAKDSPKVDPPKPEMPKFESIKDEIQAETPSSPFSGFSQPDEPLPSAPEDRSTDPTFLQPEPPKFNEPSLSPPSFGDLSAKDDAEDDLPATMIQNSWDAGNTPPSNWSDSPFSKPEDKPASSPFGQTPQSPFESPSSPFDASPQSYDAPKNIDPPKPTYQEPPPMQFGSGQSQFDQANNQSFGNQPLQQNDWNPPPAPSAGWQDQGLGAQTPFQPPVAMQGQNQTLPIISLVFGILSVCCYIGPITGIVALITGYLGMKNANADPNQYGGKGLAMAGMIVGGIFFVIYTLLWILYILGIATLVALPNG
jgi:hypothetical protein